MIRLVQYRDTSDEPQVAAAVDGEFRRVDVSGGTYGLALQAIETGISLQQLIFRNLADQIDIAAEYDQGRLLCAISHPDPAHLHLTGTGLTHLGSAEGRDAMHKAAASGAQTDSMRMFQMGVESGKPGSGPGCQPEWFYKGDGTCLVGPTDPICSPNFALDGGEEPEIAGIYIIDVEGSPRRLGFALANEFSDHVTERQNYLWLAHSKLRPAVLGAEIYVGDLPNDVRGTSRIVRDGNTIWQAPFLSGEANMSHSIANLEHHHFKYDVFRRPGDVHIHFFGTATLSFAESIETKPGDIFEIEAEPFVLPLRNQLRVSEPREVQVRVF